MSSDDGWATSSLAHRGDVANIRTSLGVAIHTKVRPLQVKRAHCYRVLMRSMKKPDSPWEAVTTSGFVVVCPSYKEASELVWMVGGRHFPRPSAQTEEQYLAWLLQHHFKIEPYRAGSARLEVMFSEFLRGWYPAAEDILHPRGVITAERREDPRTNYRPTSLPLMIDAALGSRWEGR